MKAGFVSPIIYFADTPSSTNSNKDDTLYWTFGKENENDYEAYLSVTVLGFLEATFEPIDVHAHYERINKPNPAGSFKSLNIVPPFRLNNQDEFENRIIAIEEGKRIAKGTPKLCT